MLKLITFILLCTVCARSARILGIYPLPGVSHYNLGRALFRELAERGHDVTVINSFGEKEPPKNGTYRDILINDLFDPKDEKAARKNWNMFKRQGLNPFIGAYVVSKMAVKFIPNLLNHTKIQQLLHSDEKFDVVIVDNFLSDAFKAFATHFDAPLIAVSPIWANFWINQLTGNPSPSSYIPNALTDYNHPMSFCDRLMNFLVDVFDYFIYHYQVYPKHKQYAKDLIPRGGNLDDILYNTSLVLVNSHASLNQQTPLVPNMVEVGGFHLKPPKKLPQDLQEFLDGAKEGVVYFSMGSNLQGVNFPQEKKDAFIKAFGKLKQKVLWKWEDDELEGKPDNVKILKWVPQHDVLAHPNVKLFITHGGFVSSTETAYNGVPMLAIPIYGDQWQNAYFAANNGFGNYIKYEEISEEVVLEKILQIVNNPSYKENAIRRSKLFHDREVHPMDKAVYWVEYVIRNRGAPHLRVAGIDLPWYKYYLLDVIAFLASISFMVLLVTKIVFKKVCRKLCSKKKDKKVKRS